jgi:DNA-binding NtrC family response regulator
MEEAQGGTFLLDEITEMEPATQVKLLRVLQERTLRRVGGNREIPIDVRFLAATNRSLAEAVAQKRLREDLYFRLAVVTLAVPPLRQRREDLPTLATHFLGELSAAYGRKIDGFSPRALERLQAYAWPGNVRELRNVIERAVSLATHAVIREEDLPAEIAQAQTHRIDVDVTEPYESAKARALEQFQREYFSALMAEEAGNISRVAVRAQVDRKTVYRILKVEGGEE